MSYLSAEEAIDLGVLMEVNRRLLHPRGLAAQIIGPTEGRTVHTLVTEKDVFESLKALVEWARDKTDLNWSAQTYDALIERLNKTIDSEGAAVIQIQDYRDDPEGVYFDSFDKDDQEKLVAFMALATSTARARHDALGYNIQRLGLPPLVDRDPGDETPAA